MYAPIAYIHEVMNMLYFLSSSGRLKHGRHFTFKNYDGDSAITFVSSQVEGIFVDELHPFKARGPWLQVSVIK